MVVPGREQGVRQGDGEAGGSGPTLQGLPETAAELGPLGLVEGEVQDLPRRQGAGEVPLGHLLGQAVAAQDLSPRGEEEEGVESAFREGAHRGLAEEQALYRVQHRVRHHREAPSRKRG